MKTENRKKENAGSMESLELTHSTRERERKREKHTENYIPKNSNSMFLHVCVFNAHVLYKSLQGLTEVLSYFNAL